MMDVALAPLEEASMCFKLHNTPTHSSLSLPSSTIFPYALGNYGLYFLSDAQWREEHSVDASVKVRINGLLKLLFLLSEQQHQSFPHFFSLFSLMLDLQSHCQALGDFKRLNWTSLKGMSKSESQTFSFSSSTPKTRRRSGCRARLSLLASHPHAERQDRSKTLLSALSLYLIPSLHPCLFLFFFITLCYFFSTYSNSLF